MIGRYKKCIDVLFNDSNECHNKVLRSIVNTQDNTGATPLHYAVDNWPKEVAKQLLNLGADVTIKTNNLEPPLTNIAAETIKEFLDEQCMFADGFNAETESECDDTDEEQDPEYCEQTVDEYDTTSVSYTHLTLPTKA